MFKRIVRAAVVLAVLVPAAAQAMTGDEFLAKANKLKSKGMMALFSSDLPAVKEEVNGASRAWVADKAARKAAGKPPLACPPTGAKMDSDQFLAAFAALLPAERQMSFRDGYARVIVKKYPCG